MTGKSFQFSPPFTPRHLAVVDGDDGDEENAEDDGDAYEYEYESKGKPRKSVVVDDCSEDGESDDS